MRSRDRRRHGPKAKKENDDPETHRPGVNDDTENARKMKGAPDKLISLACIIRDVCRLSDSTGASAPEQKALCDDIRSIQTAHAERYDVVKGGGRADVDQADETGDE